MLDADCTTIDNIGDLERFQKHRHLLKYFGEINALPGSNGLRMGLITRNITNNPTDKPRAFSSVTVLMCRCWISWPIFR